jgi:hypothetical protein
MRRWMGKYELLVLAYDCIRIQDKPKGGNFIEFARDHQLPGGDKGAVGVAMI